MRVDEKRLAELEALHAETMRRTSAVSIVAADNAFDTAVHIALPDLLADLRDARAALSEIACLGLHVTGGAQRIARAALATSSRNAGDSPSLSADISKETNDGT